MSESKKRIESLIAVANTKTGGSAADLTEAVQELCNGYGVGGNNDVLKSIIERTVKEVSDETVTNIGRSAFNSCSNLISAEFPNTTDISSNSFSDCSNLISANFPKVTRISTSSFNGCSSLASCNLPLLTEVGASAFSRCSSLKSVDFPKVHTLLSNAFQGCSQLVIVNLPSLTNIKSYAFEGCVSLSNIRLPETVTEIAGGVFASCEALEIIDITSTITTGFTAGTFNATKSLKALILRSETLIPLKTAVSNAFRWWTDPHTGDPTYNPVMEGTGFIYVPRVLVDSYKIATNWTEIASQFRALEDYTVDGTLTGALDDSKI